MEHEKVFRWFDEYGESIFTYILLMVGNYRQAEELTQETFLQAYRNQQRFDESASFKIGLFSVAYNVMKHSFRKNQPLQHYLGLTVGKVNRWQAPEQMGEVQSQHKQLYAAILQLKHTYRHIIILNKIKEFSLSETADILRWPESKVKLTLERGLAELKNIRVEEAALSEASLDKTLKQLEEAVKADIQRNRQSERQMIHPKKHLSKKYKWLTALFCLLFLLLPFYPAMLENTLSCFAIPLFTNKTTNEQSELSVTEGVADLIEEEGYVVEFLAVDQEEAGKPTLEVVIQTDESSFEKAKEHLEPLIEEHLHKNGHRAYRVLFHSPTPFHEIEMKPLTQKVNEIVQDTFTIHGYAEEARYWLTDLQKNGDSYIVLLKMPSHITEREIIVTDIKSAFEEQQVEISDIEVLPISLFYRMRNDRWNYITSQLYDALRWKSAYLVSGVSYEIEEDEISIWVNTDWNHPPSEEQMQTIQHAVQAYLSLPKAQKKIQKDAYTITFLMSNLKPFMEMTGEKEADV